MAETIDSTATSEPATRRGHSPNSRANLKQFRPPPAEPAPKPTAAGIPGSELATIQPDQPLNAKQIINAAAPGAAQVLVRVASGSIRAPIKERLSAAVKILEGAGVLGPDASAGDEDEQTPAAVAAWLGSAVKAAEFARRKASASDADVIESTARDVTPQTDSESPAQEPVK